MTNEKEKLTSFLLQTFPMPAATVASIANLFKEKEFARHDFVLKEGRICNEYYFLETGFMRAFTFDHEGNDITTTFYVADQIVCELLSFFKRIPSRENIESLTDCRCWYISFDELQTVFHGIPEFREFGRTILINAYSRLKQRMLSMIQETAETRYVSLLQSSPDIFQHAQLKYIATYLGITDTSLSRIRKDFSKR